MLKGTIFNLKDLTYTEKMLDKSRINFKTFYNEILQEKYLQVEHLSPLMLLCCPSCHAPILKVNVKKVPFQTRRSMGQSSSPFYVTSAYEEIALCPAAFTFT